MILLTLPSHSKKPWQQDHPKRPSDKAITHSAQGRLATHLPLATHLAGQRMSYYYKSALRCASLSAHESGIFCLLFFAIEKKEVAARRRHRRSQRIEGNPRGVRTKRFRQATHECYGTSVSHSSFIPDGRQDTDNLKSNWYYTRGGRHCARPNRRTVRRGAVGHILAGLTGTLSPYNKQYRTTGKQLVGTNVSPCPPNG